MTAWDGLIEHGWVQYLSRVGIMYSWAHSQIYWCSGMSDCPALAYSVMAATATSHGGGCLSVH
jgi:hypothetical protein